MMQSVHRSSVTTRDNARLTDRQKEIVRLIVDIRTEKTAKIAAELKETTKLLVEDGNATNREISGRLRGILKRLEDRIAKNDELASRLGCGEGTVKIHLHSILIRTGLHTKEELADWGAKHKEMLV